MDRKKILICCRARALLEFEEAKANAMGSKVTQCSQWVGRSRTRRFCCDRYGIVMLFVCDCDFTDAALGVLVSLGNIRGSVGVYRGESRGTMKKSISIAVGIALLALANAACSQYFPPYALERKNPRFSEFKRPWYSSQLKALHEPSLFSMKKNQSAEAYRFLWLRTFHHPIALRLEPQPNGTGMLTIKMTNGAGGFAPGTLVDDRSIIISKEQLDAFRSKLVAVKFWSTANPVIDQEGTDGSQWVIEGVKSGKYHVVDRWDPKSGPVRELGEMLAFTFAKLDVPKNEIY